MILLFLILDKVVAREFYRISAGFFLVVIGIGFGFMSKAEHVALAQLFVSTAYLSFVPVGLWCLYALKIMQFNRQTTGLSQNYFLSSILHLSLFRKSALLFCEAGIELLPAILYGIFLAAIAKEAQHFAAMYIIGGSLLLLTGLIAYSLHHNLLHTSREARVTFFKRVFDAQFIKPQIQFFIEWIIRKQPVLFFGIKLFGCLIIMAVAHLYVADAYDGRLMGLGMLLVAAANSVVAFHYHQFENRDFQLLRNFPVTHTRRILLFLMSGFVLCLPEWIFLYRFFPDVLGIAVYCNLVLLALSLMLLSYALLFTRHILFEKYVRHIFFLFITLMLLVLFKVPFVILIVILSVLAIYFIRTYYYNFEFIAGKEL